jgi:hypothetical protein
MSTQEVKCPNLDNGGKVNVKVSILSVKVKYGTKFNVHLEHWGRHHGVQDFDGG